MKLSMIIPAYNAEKYIKRCLESVEKQTIFSVIELILIDDGSKDNTGEIMKEFAKKYKNVIVEHTKNLGVSSARNLGIEMATCEYICFLDSDDYIDENLCESLLNEISSNIDMVVSGFVVEYSKGHKVIRKAKSKEIVEKKDINKKFLYGLDLDPNVTHKLFKKSLINELRFRKDIAIAEDKLFLFYYLQKSNRIAIIPEAKYYYYMNDESACRSDFSFNKLDSIIVAKEITEYIKKNDPELLELAECMEIDVKCRVCGELSKSKNKKIFKCEYNKFKKDIRKFKIKTKMKYSTKKHIIAFIFAKISPRLYQTIKSNLKLQYK